MSAIMIGQNLVEVSKSLRYVARILFTKLTLTESSTRSAIATLTNKQGLSVVVKSSQRMQNQIPNQERLLVQDWLKDIMLEVNARVKEFKRERRLGFRNRVTRFFKNTNIM